MAVHCPTCGHPNEAGVFCAQCGASLGARTPAASSGGRVDSSRTVLGISASDLLPPTPHAPPAAPNEPSGPPADPNARARTVLGIPGMPPPVAAPAPAVPMPLPPPSARTVLGMPAIPTPAPAAASGAPQSPETHKTMLGVARPGIAPLAASGAAPAPPPHASQGPGPASAAARIAVENENRTMLGVAVPGQVPPKPGLYTASVPIAPAPPPLELEPLPVAPKKVKKKGFPLGPVAAGLLALVVGVGVTAVLLLKGGSPLVVVPKLSPRGTDVLQLRCDSCPDATKVSLSGSAAEFKNKEAELELKTQLVVGDNPLVLRLDRPGVGRDEDVKASVPVRYRIRADLSDIAAAAPSVSIVVEAEPGAKVTLDGAPFSLDAAGRGKLPIALSAETSGMADETKLIDKTVAYEVTLKDKVEKGNVSARAAVPALRIDAPLTKTVIAQDRFFVAGRTIKGATITINGRPVTVDGAGIFAEPFGAPTVAEIPIEVRATLPQSAARTVTLKIRRADQLEAQARAQDKATPAGPYRDLLTNTAAYAGKPRAVEGDLVESRETNHQAILLVRDRRGCDVPDGNCLVRILHGASIDAKPGARVLAVGRVTRLFTAGATAVPEMEAEIVIPSGRR